VPVGIQRVGGPVIVDSSFRAWVIDTGIDSDHPDLNVGQGANFMFISFGSGNLLFYFVESQQRRVTQEPASETSA